jgi:hypothetical protein
MGLRGAFATSFVGEVGLIVCASDGEVDRGTIAALIDREKEKKYVILSEKCVIITKSTLVELGMKF